MRDRAAYARQVALLCEPERTCFLNFYTNGTGAPVAMPLPDAIDREVTAVYRRSAKQGAERFQWSCRMQVSQDRCSMRAYSNGICSRGIGLCVRQAASGSHLATQSGNCAAGMGLAMP